MNPLMQSMAPKNNMMQLFQMLRNGNPEQIAMQMMAQNPQFKAFMDANRGKTPTQVAQEMGVDLNQFLPKR